MVNNRRNHWNGIGLVRVKSVRIPHLRLVYRLQIFMKCSLCVLYQFAFVQSYFSDTVNEF